MIKIPHFIPLLILVSIFTLVGCSNVPEQVHLQGRTMGTGYNVKFTLVPSLDVTQLHKEIDAELVHINKLMSTYDPESELSLFNKNPSTDSIALSPATMKVMQASMYIGKMSSGYLDITVGPLVNMWGFGPNAKPEKIPSQEMISEIREKTGLDKLILDESHARKLHPEMYIDLSTTAKGYGVDVLAEMLEAKGVTNYLVEIGGEMRASGTKPDGNGWTIAIEKPVSMERAVQQLVNIGNNAIATSGDYRNYFEESGVRYSHLIDPVTGYPIRHNVVAVSVVHESALMADGLATAIIVMGKEKGMAMANQENIAVLMITRENGEFIQYTTPAFSSFLIEK